MPRQPRTITALRLTPEGYAPFGDVVTASPRGEGGRIVNQGMARRWDHLTPLINLRGADASLNVSVFRCTPRLESVIPIEILEKHPSSTQAFLPMNAARYLVIVALGGDAPELSTLAAFIAHGTEGISYRPGVWHHPMIALDHETDFSCLVWEDGSRDDCTIVSYGRGVDADVVVRVAPPTSY